ncbi:MAG: deoxynucleoside kinase [Ureaplasma sp.]|nr:deoxynucleoside kinase [Ureaplasma sp.]
MEKHEQIRPNAKKIKLSNSIAIGGMIAFGKSTISNALKNAIENSNVIYELDDNDQLMMLLLEKMYEREDNELFGPLFQLYFVLNRFRNYKKNCNQKNLTIFDRSIFEDWLFANENISRPAVFNYYNSLWTSIVNELIYELGVPKLYIILDGDWDLFEERIYKRNREVEIANYEKNKEYFKHLLNIYKDYLVNVCKDFGINYLIIPANLTTEEQVKIVLKKLSEIEKYESK